MGFFSFKPNGKYVEPEASVPPPAPQAETGPQPQPPDQPSRNNGYGNRPPQAPRQAPPMPAPEPRKAPGFRRATKRGSKARVALIGVSGGGKSLTGLLLARTLAGPQGKIAAVDTEHGSLSKYADEFDFDVDQPDSYTTDYLIAQLDFAERNGYAVFFVDSLSHFWMGRDGALEFVDKVTKRTQNGNKDSFTGWKAFAPHERELVDRFLASPCHIIVTMRVKTEYQEVIVDGRKKRVKVGLEPVQRGGLEYEFDLVCSMDDENNLMIDKTRCSAYMDERLRVVSRPTEAYFQPFIQWLDGPAPEPARPEAPSPASPQAASTPQPVATPQPRPADPPASNGKPWTTRGGARRVLESLREVVGEDDFLAELERVGVRSIEDLLRHPDKATLCYYALQAKADSQEI